ncbi:hypothetical protein SELMODRAFT_93404 [Selaginella moellendorffii]|uniref:Pentacotripeptide-repeat region of PRORP domain-containing protein n=1 Tax=Selaginella moellendorffii TaxID=88036 RepID=D8RHM6_SELML|nr:hypothetical protein SELMODRAFT_93404 [Selaginella moellendorffii]
MSNAWQQRDLASAIQLCGDARDHAAGSRIHADIAGSRRWNGDRYLANLLIEMYGKCGDLGAARAVFDNLGSPNRFSWTILFAAYARNGKLEDARRVFEEMPERGIVVWNSLLSLLGKRGMIAEAERVFEAMKGRRNALFDAISDKDGVSWNTILAAYAQAGDLTSASSIFLGAPERSSISWNTMLASTSGFACAAQAMELFHEMAIEGHSPDQLSFSSLLNACSHAGSIDQSLLLFHAMARDHQELLIESQHVTTMVDALGRAGRTLAAQELAEDDGRDAVAVRSLLGACRIHHNVELSTRLAGENSSPPLRCGSNFSLLANTYSATAAVL